MKAADVRDEGADLGGADIDADYDLVACDRDTSAAPRSARITTMQFWRLAGSSNDNFTSPEIGPFQEAHVDEFGATSLLFE